MKIGIIDFNTVNAADVLASLNSLSSLIPEKAYYRIINFRNDHDFNQYDVLILTGSALSAFAFQEMRKNQKVVRCEDKYIANNDDILNFINGKIKSFVIHS